ncbi:MAG: helix-turn-helix domain-containing protein [Planctomycetota bacterium]|jgi:transposase
MPRPHRDPKDEALREQGVRNPHPETVNDPSFHEGDFFDPRDLMQVKYEMVRRVEVEGAPVTRAAAEFGLSRPTFYEARKAVEEEGLPGLIPKKRGPRGGHKITAEVLSFLEAAREEDPGVEVKELARRVAARFGRAVHPRTVQRALTRRKKKRR